MLKNNSTKHIVKFLWDQRKVSPKLVYLMLLSQVVMTILSSTIAPIFVSQLLTHIASGTASMKNDMGLLIIYSIILFISNVVVMRITILLAYITETKMQSVVAQNVLEKLTSKSLGYHANRMSGGIVSDANRLTGSVERFWDMMVFNITPILTTIISTCIVLGFVLWQFSVILAILSVIIIALIIKVQMSRTEYSKEVAERSSAMTAHLADVVGNISTVKAFGREVSELIKYDSLNVEWRKANMKEMKYNLTTSFAFGLVMNVMNAMAFAAAIIATENKIAEIGVTYLVISYTLNVVSHLWATSHATRTFLRVIGDASPMIKTLGEDIEITDPKKPRKIVVKKGEISFKNITFTHEKNKTALFDNFSLDIKAGERIGLIGKSGAGKTSLTRLLLRFSDIEGGEILIDGQDITKSNQKDLRQVIAFVSQEPTLFHRSLKDNIAYGKPDATEEEVWNAAKKANATDFIKDLPDGLNTLVGERGVKLSGGQRQRVAIARAMLKDAPILVLDEATSALDSENEKLIQDALAKLMKNRTSIVIAHRLSTIAKLDRIIVIDDGKITEQGSHQELLKHNGIYAQLWQHQSGGFIE
jgi:ATP-binding cassette subfamily B protein